MKIPPPKLVLFTSCDGFPCGVVYKAQAGYSSLSLLASPNGALQLHRRRGNPARAALVRERRSDLVIAHGKPLIKRGYTGRLGDEGM